MKAELKKIELNDLEMLLSWRNDVSVRKWMYSSQEISLDQHIKWYNDVSTSQQKLGFIFYYNNEPTGFVSFHLDKHFCEWGFYIKPHARKGVGMILGQTAILYAFDILGVQKIFGQVLAFNEKSISFHRKLGFKQEGLLRQHFKDSRGEFDIFQFGLLKSEWLER